MDPALGITLSVAGTIDNHGQIVADDLSTGRGYLLTPIPEPRTVALFGLALLGLAASSRLRRKRSATSDKFT